MSVAHQVPSNTPTGRKIPASSSERTKPLGEIGGRADMALGVLIYLQRLKVKVRRATRAGSQELGHKSWVTRAWENVGMVTESRSWVRRHRVQLEW